MTLQSNVIPRTGRFRTPLNREDWALIFADLQSLDTLSSQQAILSNIFSVAGSTRNSSYTVLGGGFIYRGSDTVAIPGSIEAVVFKDIGAATMDIRIFDFTNAIVIAEMTGITDTIPTIQDLGTLSNIPAAQAIWEVQARRVGNPSNTDCFVNSISIL